MIDCLPEQELRQMYHSDQMSISEIAKVVGVSYSTVHNRMQKYGVKSRTVSESKLINTPILSKEELQEMYLDQEMDTNEIGKAVNVSGMTVCRLMKKYDIKSRTHSEARLIGINIPSKGELTEMYCDEKMSSGEIGKKIGVNRSTVLRWIRLYDIYVRTSTESLTDKYTGENASNWNGGISFEPYCKKFNNGFKESVRARDDYTCQLCGHEQPMDGQKLDVHHIHYDKENCYPDVVALCRSCNAKVNFDRGFWENFFENQLIERELLNWSMQ